MSDTRQLCTSCDLTPGHVGMHRLKCPRCDSTNTRQATHWEDLSTVCNDCGYGT